MKICTIENVLMDDPNIVAIHRPRILYLPVVNPNIFAEEYREDRKTVVRLCIEYLRMPLIEDRFEDNIQRKEWIYKLKGEYPGFENFYDKNALRYNFLSGISMCMHGFDRGYIGTNIRIFHELKELVRNSVPSIKVYDKIPTPTKIAFIKKYKTRIKRMLNFLSKQVPISPASSSN